jgi:hypothetical protein
MADPNWSDPCAILAWLRPQYYRIAAGLQTTKVRFRHGDGEREVMFSQGNLKSLEELMSRLEADCAGRGRRRAIVCG